MAVAAPPAAPCPACGAGAGEALWEVDATRAAQHFVLREAEPERHAALERKIRALWGGDRCRVVRCAGCGFCHAEPHVGGDAEFYALAYERTHYPEGKWEHRVTREALLAAPERPRTLLEVGAGDGAFLRTVVPSSIRPEDVLATEYSDYGQRRVRELGVRCEAIDVRELPRELDGRFDALCLFQVLEHLDRPGEVLDRLHRLGRGPAQLFVAVPNHLQIDFNERHGALLDMPPNHIGRWTRAAFEAIAPRHGWRLEEHRVEEEPLLSRARRFLAYRHLRATQRAGSVPNRIRSLPPSPLRLALDAGWIGLTLPLALPSLAALGRRGGGDAQWARFTRLG